MSLRSTTGCRLGSLRHPRRPEGRLRSPTGQLRGPTGQLRGPTGQLRGSSGHHGGSVHQVEGLQTGRHARSPQSLAAGQADLLRSGQKTMAGGSDGGPQTRQAGAWRSREAVALKFSLSIIPLSNEFSPSSSARSAALRFDGRHGGCKPPPRGLHAVLWLSAGAQQAGSLFSVIARAGPGIPRGCNPRFGGTRG